MSGIIDGAGSVGAMMFMASSRRTEILLVDE